MTAQLGLPGIRTRRRSLLRRDRPACPAEFDLQCALMTWAKLNEGRWPELALLHHVPNGSHRYRNVAAGLKRAGVKPGVPDLVLPVPRGAYHGCYLELKSRAGTLSSAQRWWHAQLAAQGYCTRVARSLEEGIAILEGYLCPNAPPA